MSRLRETPQALPVRAFPTGAIEQMRRDDWQRLLDAIFDTLQGPLAMDDLVAIITRLLGMQEEQPEPFHNDPNIQPGRWTETRDVLNRLWQAILQLRPRYRVAYLLNPSGGELDVFPWHGIATIRDIGQALALPATQYELLWLALPLTEEERRHAQTLQTSDQQFALLWRFLPLEDTLIAQVLGATRQQVINLRRLARDSLLRQLRVFR